MRWKRAVAIRAVVAEDELVAREGLVRLLSSAPDIEVVSACENYDALQSAVENENPDVVLTDIRMPPTSTNEGIRLAQELRVSHPTVGVVVLSQFAEPEYVRRLFESGSDRRAYLLKERLRDRATLLSAIRSVAAGGSAVDPNIIEVLVSARSEDPGSPLAELTPREREVLASVAQGKNNSAIAAELVITTRSVEKNIRSIFMKLGFGDADGISKRVKAALIFLSQPEADVDS